MFQSLYNRILLTIKQNNIKGTAYGEVLGLRKSPLTDWKNGRSKPTLEQVVKTCGIFGTSADFLLFGIEKNKKLLPDEKELLELYQQLPLADRRECIGYIRGFIAHSQKELKKEVNQEQQKIVG